MAFIRPSVDDFKNYFTRDFPYTGEGDQAGVMPSDITKAYGQTEMNFNEDLFATQENFTLCYLLLAAHYLVVDLRMSSQGIAGKYSWLATSRSVGSISESYGIPEAILQVPEYSMLTQTPYGAKFLALVLPLLKGAMFSVRGRTHA